MSREEAQAQAIAQIRNMRYGPERKDYFWINDMFPRIVMHPYRSDLEGKDFYNPKDPQGKYLVVEIVNVVRENTVRGMWTICGNGKMIRESRPEVVVC